MFQVALYLTPIRKCDQKTVWQSSLPLQASAMTEDDSQSDSGGSNGSALPSAVFDISRRGLSALAVSPDGTRLATAARDGIVRIHELSTGALLSGFRVRLSFSYWPKRWVGNCSARMGLWTTQTLTNLQSFWTTVGYAATPSSVGCCES